MLRRRVFWLLAVVVLCSGCTRCLVMRSEYFDITGKVFVPKSEDSDVPILEAPPEREFVRIGTVRAWARSGTAPEAIREELKRRGRLAGADALMEVEIGEDEQADFVFCGKVFTTKRHTTGRATAIVYKEATGEKQEDQARNPALYNL